MPEWMKRFILSVYDAFLRAVDFMYAKLSALIYLSLKSPAVGY